MKKRILPALLAFVFVLTLLPIHAQADGGVIVVTLKSGLPGVEDIVINSSMSFGLYVTSNEDFVNGKFTQEWVGGILYTKYKVSDVPDSFGRTDLLCWKVTYLNLGYSTVAYPGDVITDSGSNANFTLEAIWDGLEKNSYAFSSPQSVTVTENTEIINIPFTLSELTLGSADQMKLALYPGDFSDGVNTIHYDTPDLAIYTEVGQTEYYPIGISPEEWAKAKAGRYTATLEYEVSFEIRGSGISSFSIRTLHGSVPMTLQVGHDVTVSANPQSRGTASASAAMARAGETVTLTATPADERFGLRSWRVESGGVTVNPDNTFVMGNEDVAVTAMFDLLYDARFRNYDETLLYVDRVFEGETPEYAGETPVKPSTERSDYIFTGWNPPLAPIDQTTRFTAQFREEHKYFVHFDANGGAGTMDSGMFYASAGTYTLPSCGFTAPEGRVFRDWTVTWENDDGTSSAATYIAGATVTGLSRDITVSPNWMELSVKASPANAGIAEYADGEFTATANEGYTFRHWEYADDENSPGPVGMKWPEDNPYQPAAVDYKIYTAVFTANEYRLTIADGIQNGTVAKDSGTPKTGSKIKLTVTPNDGYQLTLLTYTPEGDAPVNITEKDNNGKYFFIMPPANVTINATFTPIHTVTVNGGTGGGDYVEGASVTITANAPEAGMQFKKWTGTNGLTFTEGDATTATATFTMPAGAVMLTATYEAITYPVTVDVQGDAGKISYTLWAKAGELSASSSFADQGAQRAETAIPEGCTLGLEVTSQGAKTLFIEISSTTGQTIQGYHSFSDGNVCRVVAEPTGPVTVTLVVDPAWLFLYPNGAAGDGQTLLAPINCAATVPDNPFTRDGYKFTGWNTAADGSGTAYAAGETITPTGNITLYARWEAAYAYVTAATASFNDKISLNFYIEIPEGWRNGAYAVLTCGSDTKTVAVSETIRSKETERVGYKFSYALLAKQIEDEVTIRLYDAEGQPLPLKNEAGTNDYTETGVPMTVLRYVNAMIEKGSDSMKALAQAAKDYGYAAKQKFSGGSCTISSAVAGVSAGDLNAYAAEISGALPAGVEIEFITAMFESDNAFRLYLRFADTVNVEGLQFWLDDASHPLTLQTRSDGKQYLTFTGVTSTKLGEAHTFYISDESDTCSIRVSVLTYARSVLTNDATAPMKTLAQALYLYNQKALEHFTNN